MPKTAVLTADAKAAKRKAFRKHLKRYWVLYAMAGQGPVRHGMDAALF